MGKRYRNLGKVIRQDQTTGMFNTMDIDETDRQEKFEKERKTYGFDERETWNLSFTSITWLYAHLKKYKQLTTAEIYGDLAHKYKVKIIDKDEGSRLYRFSYDRKFYKYSRYEDKVRFKYKYRVLSLGEIIDIILEYFEYYFKYNTDYEDELSNYIAKEAFKLYGIILPSLRW